MEPLKEIQICRDEKWIDVTIPIHSGMVHWPTDPPIRIQPQNSVLGDHSVNLSSLFFGSHTGTHVDPPYHFIPDGGRVDEISWDRLIGPARVVDATKQRTIDASFLNNLEIQPGERLLFKTENSTHWKEDSFFKDYVYLTPDGAEKLSASRLAMVGIDYLSIGGGSDEENAQTHKILLKEKICILEGLDLSRVNPGLYEIFCFPLKIKGGDGAPARVLLRAC